MRMPRGLWLWPVGLMCFVAFEKTIDRFENSIFRRMFTAVKTIVTVNVADNVVRYVHKCNLHICDCSCIALAEVFTQTGMA
eukprot:jgi/Botrbrau1/9159/Bobra.160_3s0031.1